MDNRVSEATASTSPSMLAQARAGDPNAWQRLSRIYGPLIYRWARQAGLQESDASDLAQEVFGVVTSRIRDFRCNRPGDSFRAWLWGITANKLKEYFRKRVANPPGAGGTEAQIQLNAIPESPPEDSRDADRLDTNTTLMHRAVELIRDEFEDKTWRAFWGTAIDQQKTTDIARELGMTSKAVRQAKYRVLKRLRLEMED